MQISYRYKKKRTKRTDVRVIFLYKGYTLLFVGDEKFKPSLLRLSYCFCFTFVYRMSSKI